MLPGKAPEVKLATGHKLLIWRTLEACGKAGDAACNGWLRSLRGTLRSGSGRRTLPSGLPLGEAPVVEAGAADCGRLAQSSARGEGLPPRPSLPPTTATCLFGGQCGLRRVGGWTVCLALFVGLVFVQPGQQGSMAGSGLLDGRYLTKRLSRQLSGQVEALGGDGFQDCEVALDGGEVSSRHGSGDRGEGGAGGRSCDGRGDGATGQLQVAARDLGRQAGLPCQVRRGGKQGGDAAGGQGGREVIERPGSCR